MQLAGPDHNELHEDEDGRHDLGVVDALGAAAAPSSSGHGQGILADGTRAGAALRRQSVAVQVLGHEEQQQSEEGPDGAKDGHLVRTLQRYFRKTSIKTLF